MPSQPAWFHRLDEILALLRGFDTGYLDRLAVGRLFGVRQRRACVVEYHDCSRHAIDASVACATAVTIGLSLAASYRPRYFFTRCRMSPQMWRATVNSLIADRTELWWTSNRPDQAGLWESKIELSEKFFQEIIRHPVPIDINTLTALKRCFNFQQSVRDPQVRKRNSMDCVRSQQQSQ